MGKKPQHSAKSGKKEQEEPLLQPKQSTSTAQSQANDPIPSKSEVERRRRLFFGEPKRENPPSKSELAYFKSLVDCEYIQSIMKEFEQLKITIDEKPTFDIKPIFPAELVIRTLKAAFLMLSEEMNCLELIIPGIERKEYDELLQKYTREENIKQQVTQIFELPANRPVLQAPKLLVIGDTHGTFEVLEMLFTQENLNENTMFLFNGDYVDRGSFSIEILVLLLQMKLAGYNVYLLRGNHEISSVCENYSFKLELEKKYAENALDIFNHAVQFFYSLPIAATINDSWFLVHGGLPGWTDFDIFSLNELNRFRDPETDLFKHFHTFDPLNDLLWADPSDDVKSVEFNDTRGASVKFGELAVRKFLKKTDLKYFLRSHTCVERGYAINHNGITYTLFSVPKYNSENLGAYMAMYGVYNENEPVPDAIKKLYGDTCNGHDYYLKKPTEPQVFIKQFTCSDNSSIINEPLIEDMSENMMKRNLEALMAQYGGPEAFEEMMKAEGLEFGNGVE